MYLIIRKCIIPLALDVNVRINSSVITLCKNTRHTIACLVNFHNVRARPEAGEDTEKKCSRPEDFRMHLEKMCHLGGEPKLDLLPPLEYGVMENKPGIGLEKDNSESTAPKVARTRTDMDSPSESQFDRNSERRATIKRDLNRLRWTEYSPYGRELFQSNKWESIKNELITVVTYNVLSQILLEKHKYLYYGHDEASLKWNSRSQTLLEEFSNFNADILCLQEIDSCLLKSFYDKHLHGMGYYGIYKQRTNDKVDGCAIYFKKSKFNLIKFTPVEMYNRTVHLLDRDNIGIILKLSLKSNPELELIVATTHLLYNPKRGDIKLAQTQLMLAEIEKLAYKNRNPETQQPEYLPIIFTGDMNYSPDNGVYQLVTKSFLEYEGASSEKLTRTNRGRSLDKLLLPRRVGITDSCQYESSLSKREGDNEMSFSTGALGHYLNLESVYSHVKGNLPEATTNQDRWVTVDYIFYSQSFDRERRRRKDGNLKLISRLTLPNSEEAENYLKHLPNLACGSDHLPLMATFLLTGPS